MAEQLSLQHHNMINLAAQVLSLPSKENQVAVALIYKQTFQDGRTHHSGVTTYLPVRCAQYTCSSANS